MSTSLSYKPAPAADTRGCVGRESVIQNTLDLCAAAMFKIVLALSLVDRRSSQLTRRGGPVLQHRQPVASLRGSKGTQRFIYCCDVLCRFLRKDHHVEGVNGSRGASLGFASPPRMRHEHRAHTGCMGGNECVGSAAVHCCGSLTCTVFTAASFDHNHFQTSKRVGGSYATETV